MPIVPVNFKSDKEIEGELFRSETKVQRYIPNNIEIRTCDMCSSYEKANCMVYVNPYCQICNMAADEKKMFESCGYFVIPKCKKDHPLSVVFIECPDYDGPETLEGMTEFLRKVVNQNRNSRRTI